GGLCGVGCLPGVGGFPGTGGGGRSVRGLTTAPARGLVLSVLGETVGRPFRGVGGYPLRGVGGRPFRRVGRRPFRGVRRRFCRGHRHMRPQGDNSVQSPHTASQRVPVRPRSGGISTRRTRLRSPRTGPTTTPRRDARKGAAAVFLGRREGNSSARSACAPRKERAESRESLIRA